MSRRPNTPTQCTKCGKFSCRCTRSVSWRSPRSRCIVTNQDRSRSVSPSPDRSPDRRAGRAWCSCGKIHCGCPTSSASRSASPEVDLPILEEEAEHSSSSSEGDGAITALTPVSASRSEPRRGCIDIDRITAPVSEDLRCGICMGVPFAPVELPCGHVFCPLLLEQALHQRSECPRCHQAYGIDDVSTSSRALLNRISALQVRCHRLQVPHSTLLQVRCSHKPSHVLPFHSVTSHEQSECSGRIVCCEHGCGVSLPNEAIAAHERRCQLVGCVHEGCSVKMSAQDIVGHGEQCHHRFTFTQLADKHIIKLNVGGVSYETSRTSLQRAGWFRETLSDPISLPRDESGAFFVDRDGGSFRHVLEYLRKGPAAPLPPESERAAVLQELNHFKVASGRELVEAGYDPHDAGMSARELRSAGHSIAALCNAGYSPSEVASAGYELSVLDLKEVGFTALALKAEGHGAEALKGVGYSLFELRDACFSLRELRRANFSLRELRDSGYLLQEFEMDGAEMKELEMVKSTKSR